MQKKIRKTMGSKESWAETVMTTPKTTCSVGSWRSKVKA